MIPIQSQDIIPEVLKMQESIDNLIEMKSRLLKFLPNCGICENTGFYYLVTGGLKISGRHYDIADTYSYLTHKKCNCDYGKLRK